MSSFSVFVFVLALISLSMAVNGANSASSVPRSVMSLRDYVELGFMSKLDPLKNKVIGITATHGTNDDACFAHIVEKANSQKPEGYTIVGLYSIFANAFPVVRTDTNRHIDAKHTIICGGDALFKISEK